MLTVGDKLPKFNILGIDAENIVFPINNQTYYDKWKIIVFYPKNFTFITPNEIVGYDNYYNDFVNRNTKLLVGSVDNESIKIAWKISTPILKNIKTTMFADQKLNKSLAKQLGILTKDRFALRATFIVDPNDVIQHVTVNNFEIGRNPEETLRVLDALQTAGLQGPSRPIGGWPIKRQPVG